MATIDLTVGIDIAGAAQKLKELREAAKSAVAGVDGDINATEALFEVLNKKIQDSKNAIKEITPELANQGKQINDLQQKISSTQTKLKNASSGTINKGWENSTVKSLRKELSSLEEQLEQVKTGYNDNIYVLDKQNKKLEENQRVLKMAQTELKAQQRALKETETSYVSIRTQMTNIRNEMAQLDMAGQKNSARYKELQNELGRLGTAYRKVQFEQKALSTGATQWAGIQSTLQGIMGGFAAYQGVLGLVADSSEDLVKIQTRLQSVMGIIMGMTQVSNTLHATNAARMTTLTKVTELWTAANKRVGKALIQVGVSANTARIAAIALNGALTLGIGAAIGIAIGWITKMVEKHKEAKKSAEEAAKKQREAFDSYANDVGQKAGGTIAKFKSLQEQYNKLGDSLSAKKKFIKENADAFKELGVKIGNVNDADNLFIKNADAFVASVDARARAAATMTVASEKYKEAFEKMLEAENVRDTQKELEDNGYSKIVQSGGLNILSDDQRKELDKQLNTEKIRIQGKYTTVSTGGVVYSDYDKINEEYNEAREGIIKTFLDGVLEDLEKQKEKAEKEGEKASVSANDFTKEAREKMKNAGIVTTADDDDAKKRAKAEADAQRKLATELVNLEFVTEQAQIDMMKEGTEKKLAQIELDYKKRAHAINEGEKKLMKSLSETKKSPEQIDAAQQMQSKFKGNVDHLSRPLIAAAKLVEKGWEDAGEGIATVFSSQYGILDASGKETEILITPILPNGDVLSPEELEDYIFGTLQGAQDILKADTKKLVIATDVSIDGSAGDKYHQLQETYYNDAIKIAEKIQTQRDANSFKRQSDRYLAISGGEMQIPDLAKEQAAWDEYLIKYGTFREKLQATKDKYDRLISEAKTEGEKASIEAERDAVVAELEVEMSEWAQGLFDITLDELTKLTTQTKEQLENARNAFNNLEFSDSPEAKAYLQTINELSAKLAFLEKKEKDAKKAAKSKDWTKGAQLLNEIASTAREAASALGEFDEGLGRVATFIASMVSAAGNLITTIEGVTAASSAAGTALSAMEKASVILAAISAAFQVMQGLFSLFGFGESETTKEYEKLKAVLDNLLDVWDDLIDKKKEYLNESYGADAVAATDDMLDLVDKKDQTNRRLFEQRLKAGSSAGSHSYGYRMWQGSMSTTEGKNWRDVAPEIERNLGVGFRSMNDFTKMSAEQLQWIKENYSEYWAAMDEDAREYLDNIIKYGEEKEDIAEQLAEQLTQVSFDDFKDSFIDTLMDMDADASTFAENFSEYLQRAILTAKVSELLDGELSEWYKQFEEAMKDGELSEEEIKNLRQGFTDITNQGIELRDNLAKVTGYGEDSADAQKASARGFQAMSQDTGDELNGRFTDIQGKVTDIRDYVLQITANGTMQLNEVINIRDIMIQMNGNVADIRTNTSVLPEMSEKLDKIVRNTSNI